MQDVLFIIDPDDLPIAEKLAAKLKTAYSVYVFDPTLVDQVRASKLVNVELVTWPDALDYPTLAREAHARAHAFEARLDETAAALAPAISVKAWQHLNLFYFFLTYAWYSGLWADILPKFKGRRSHIFLCNNPSTFYWPAFMPSLLLLQYLRTFDIEFTAYPYGDRPDETDAIPFLCNPDMQAEPCDVLVHLPTCFYDAPHFDAELQASGKVVTRLVAKYWDVDVESTTLIKLIRTTPRHPFIPSPLWEESVAFADALCIEIEKMLTPYIATSSYRDSQARHFANIYKSQFLTYFLLEQHFAPALPKKILLSDHDSGFHGPLIHFARNNHIPVLMVPHAKTSEDTEFTYDQIVSCSHPMQGVPVCDPSGRQLLSQKLAYPAELSSSTAMPGPMKTIGLLLNGYTMNGIASTGWECYLEGIRKIARWCAANDIALTIRCRQGQTLYYLLEEATGIARADLRAAVSGSSLLTFAAGVDLCLMYDAPTNADLDFLRQSIPIINPIPAPLSKAEAGTANKQIVPRETVEASLEMLETFIGDPIAFQQFKVRQFADYMSLFKQARMLRELL